MKRVRSIILATASVVAITSLALAQPTGLDALSDDALLNDLAQRGLGAMLERAFEINQTPPDKREAFRAVAAFSQLTRDSASLTPGQRRQVIDRVAVGISNILPTLNDPAQIAKQADVLIAEGVKTDVNTLEYWGQSTPTQAQLRPVVTAVIAMLDRVTELSGKQIEALAAQADASDAKVLAQIESLENLSQYAAQTRAMAGYYLALSLDSSDPRRLEAAEASLAFLSEYEYAENPAIKHLEVVLGKLNLVAGKYDEARKKLDAAAALESKPPPDVDAAAFASQQRSLSFEARYFRVVVDVLSRNLVDARKRFDELIAWEQSVGIENDESIATANLLLENRLLRASGTDADRQRASTLLIELLEKRPELESQVMTQLRATITSDTPVSSLEPLLLRSLLSDGQDALRRATSEAGFKPEPRVLARGVEAAQEIISRGEKQGASIDPSLQASAKFLLGAFLEAQGDRVGAAKAFLRAAAEHRDRVELAKAALSNAQRVFAQLGGIRSEDPAVTSLYDQILPLSIGEPFNQKELCYDWAYRLQQSGKPAKAAEFYRQVEKGDRRYAASRYYLMVALHEQLDTANLPESDRGKICDEILRLADEIQASVIATLPAAAADAPQLRQRLARTVVLAADIARTELKDPHRAIALLSNVDTQVKGIPDESQLLGEAMFTRVQAYMQLGKSDEAVAELVQLLNKSGGEQGANIVFNMLSKLEADFSAAQVAGDRARMAKLQTDRAALTPYLIRWSENNPRAEIAKSAYSYRVYDAETQRLAAEFLDDPVQQKAKRLEAKKLFESLDRDEGREQYKASRSTPDRLGYDPQVRLGLSRIHFALGEWTEARDGFARLLADRVLGSPITSVSDAGQTRQVDNDVYWEATARLIRSRVNASDQSDSLKAFLREQYVRWGERVGGTKWKAEFDSLRKELIPDFVPEPLPQ